MASMKFSQSSEKFNIPKVHLNDIMEAIDHSMITLTYFVLLKFIRGGS